MVLFLTVLAITWCSFKGVEVRELSRTDYEGKSKIQRRGLWVGCVSRGVDPVGASHAGASLPDVSSAPFKLDKDVSIFPDPVDTNQSRWQNYVKIFGARYC